MGTETGLKAFLIYLGLILCLISWILVVVLKLVFLKLFKNLQICLTNSIFFVSFYSFYRLQPGISIMNAVDLTKFTLILNRIAQCIQSKSEDLKPFSEEEEGKLTDALAISRSDLTVMLDSSLYLMKQVISFSAMFIYTF